MVNGTQVTLDEFMPEIFQTQTVGASDSLVRTSALETATQVDFKENALRCFSELCTFLDNSKKKRDPLTCSLRTLRICLVLMEDGISPDFSLSWTQAGMTRNGKLSTLNITESHKTENVVSLLDIIEEPIRDEFFLSQKTQMVFLKRFNAMLAERATEV